MFLGARKTKNNVVSTIYGIYHLTEKNDARIVFIKTICFADSIIQAILMTAKPNSQIFIRIAH